MKIFLPGKKSARTVLAWCVLSALCSGCALITSDLPVESGRVISADDLVGTWKDEGGAAITFSASGGFTAERICGDSAVREGEWWIFTPSANVEPHAASQVKLDFRGGSGRVDQYEAGETGDDVVLWAALGDLDDSNYCLLVKE
ncbi:hypothetical protein ACFSL4_26275 [Streptomyces caeni]|uniref:Lipoprotein n=1 Tax=Streptomyces caeni TaxID=2307231 RepID=A0ABW4IYB5_9ACTN